MESKSNTRWLQHYLKSLKSCNPMWKDLRKEKICLNKESFNPAVEIGYDTVYGRFLVASKDILPGEVIVIEPPILIAPKGEADPTCLSCLTLLPKTEWPTCSTCGAPRCNPVCDGTHHSTKECRVLSRFRLQRLQNNIDIVKYINAILSPIRALILMRKSEMINCIMNELQSNWDDKKRLSKDIYSEENINKVFNEKLQMNANFKTIQYIVGVFDTNTFEVELGTNKTARAILPLLAMTNHSCVPNAQQWFYGGKFMILTASSFIPRGAAITISYTQTLWGNKQRKQHIFATKSFTCGCQRCQDVTELGTHYSSVRCRECPVDSTGYFVPPDEIQSPWLCNRCPSSMFSIDVKLLEKAMMMFLTKKQRSDPEGIKENISHATRMLGGQHNIVVQLKYCFIKVILDQSDEGN